jgi:endo-alpha-1,4-polygalactosaminidase (GH114 family)
MSGVIWSPRPQMFTFNMCINGPVDLVKLDKSPAHVFIVDLDFSGTTLETIRTLRTLGRIVVAYYSSGNTEKRRRNDIDALPAFTADGDLSDRDADLWLDVTHPTVRNLMMTRINRAKTIG